MEVKTIYVNYDIRRMRPPNLIAFTHENDKNTQVIELHLTDGDEPMTLNTDYTYTAAIVNSDTKALINDSIDCELNSDGNVLIPIDDLRVRGRQSLKIELTVTDEQGEQVLSLPFPIWVKVSGSILDDAQVTPESEGTVPELLEEAKEALENAGDYESLENKPQINGHELVGNKSSDDLGLQGKLTAGENITINANGEISASGGVTSYNELTDCPEINYYDFDIHRRINTTLENIQFSEDFGGSTYMGTTHLYVNNSNFFKCLADNDFDEFNVDIPPFAYREKKHFFISAHFKAERLPCNCN